MGSCNYILINIKKKKKNLKEKSIQRFVFEDLFFEFVFVFVFVQLYCAAVPCKWREQHHQERVCASHPWFVILSVINIVSASWVCN